MGPGPPMYVCGSREGPRTHGRCQRRMRAGSALQDRLQDHSVLRARADSPLWHRMGLS